MNKIMPFLMAALALGGTIWFIINWSLPDIIIGSLVSLACFGVGIHQIKNGAGEGN